MRTQILFIAAAAASAFVFGWTYPPVAEPPVAAVTALRLKVPDVRRPGSDSGIAAQYLSALNPVPPPPKPPSPTKPPVPKPPPPPDIAQVLRSAVTAVVDDRADRDLGVVVLGQGLPGRRVLHAGDTFVQGWRIASVSRREVVLKRGGETRAVPLFAAPSGA